MSCCCNCAGLGSLVRRVKLEMSCHDGASGHVIVSNTPQRHSSLYDDVDENMEKHNVGGRLQTEYTAISTASARTLAYYPPIFDVRPSDV